MKQHEGPRPTAPLQTDWVGKRIVRAEVARMFVDAAQQCENVITCIHLSDGTVLEFDAIAAPVPVVAYRVCRPEQP